MARKLTGREETALVLKAKSSSFMSPAGWSECNSTSLLGPVCISSQKPRDKAEERQDEKQTGWVICLVMHVYFTMIAYFSTPGILY